MPPLGLTAIGLMLTALALMMAVFVWKEKAEQEQQGRVQAEGRIKELEHELAEARKPNAEETT